MGVRTSSNQKRLSLIHVCNLCLSKLAALYRVSEASPWLRRDRPVSDMLKAMLPENKDPVRVIRARGRTKSSFAVETVRSVNFQTGLTRSCSSMTRHLIVIPPFQFCFFFYRLSKTRQQNVSEIDSSLGSAGFDCLPKTAWCGLPLSLIPRKSPQAGAQVDGR